MSEYITTSGDTWDVIAKKLYDDEYKADILMAANREHISTFIFNSGIKLNAPDIEGTDEDISLPPWKYDADL